MNADNEKKAELEMNISATTSGMQEVQKFPSITSGKVNGWRKANLNPFFTNLKLISFSFIKTQQIFNPAAPPFQPPYRKFEEKFPTLEVGPSKVAVNAKIWETIASERTLPTLPMRIQDFPESLQSINVRLNNQMPLFNPIRFLSGCVSSLLITVLWHYIVCFNRIIHHRMKMITFATWFSHVILARSQTQMDSLNSVCVKISGETSFVACNPDSGRLARG